MTKEQALQWEARWARPAALAAFFAAVLLIAQIVLLQTVIEDRDNIEAIPDFLLSVDENPAMLIGSRAAQAVAALLVGAVFYYLFRALQTRGAGVPSWFKYLIILGPVLYAIGLVAGALGQVDVASDFADGLPIRGAAGRRPRRAAARGQRERRRVRDQLRRPGGHGVPVRDAAAARPPRGADEPVHGNPGRRHRRAARAPDRAGGPGDHPGVLAGRPRLADHRQLAGRSRPGLGERRGGALADPAAARRRASSRGGQRAGRIAARSHERRTSPSRCRSGPARASASATANYSPGSTSSTSPNSWRR